MIREQVGEKREQAQMTDRNGPMSTPEVPTINGTSRGNKRRQQREGRKKKAKKREGKIGKGHSPDTSLVRGVGAL